jgi:hypothetical protein
MLLFLLKYRDPEITSNCGKDREQAGGPGEPKPSSSSYSREAASGRAILWPGMASGLPAIRRNQFSQVWFDTVNGPKPMDDASLLA